MSDNERNTHFANFAHLLYRDLVTLMASQEFGTHPVHSMFERHTQREQLIAQRAYDLVKHTIQHIDPYYLDALDYDEIPPRIPDMTAWPKTE